MVSKQKLPTLKQLEARLKKMGVVKIHFAINPNLKVSKSKLSRDRRIILNAIATGKVHGSKRFRDSYGLRKIKLGLDVK